MDGRKKTKAGGASGGAVDFSSLLSDLTAQFSSAHAARPAPKPARVDGAKPSSRANDDGAAPPAAALAGGDDINSLFSALDKPKKKRKREEFGGGGSTPLAAAAVSAAAAPPSTTAPAAAPASAALRLLAPLPDGVDEDVGSAVIGSGGTPLASAVLREPSPPALSASPTAAAAALLSSSSSSLPGSTLLPRLLSDMLVDVPVEVIASKLSRPVALDVATRGGAPGSLGAAVGAARGYRLPRAYLHSCHGLRVDGGPRQHDLAPMGLGAVLRLAASKHEAPRAADAGAAAAGLRPSKRSLKRALGTAVPLAQLARLHDKWCAYAWALVEAHARASGVATLLVSTSVAAPAGGGSFFAGGGGQSRASSKPGDAAGKGGVPGGFVLESLLKPTGKLKATAAAAAAAAGGDLRKTGGGANGSGTALTPAQVQRLLVTSAAVPGGLLRALDLHFAVLQVTRCLSAQELVGVRGYVVANTARHFTLAVPSGGGGDDSGGGGAAPSRASSAGAVTELRHVLVPKEGSWFLLRWPQPAAAAGALAAASPSPSSSAASTAMQPPAVGTAVPLAAATVALDSRPPWLLVELVGTKLLGATVTAAARSAAGKRGRG